MKQAALITCHNIKNYGSVFQTYATTMVFKEFGYDVLVIDYQRPGTDNDGFRKKILSELNISLLKLRKLLITADVFTSDICTEINDLYQSGKKIPEIMKLTGLSRASVHSYLPYTKGLYNAAEISLNAERCRIYKIRQEQVRLLKEIPSECCFHTKSCKLI